MQQLKTMQELALTIKGFQDKVKGGKATIDDWQALLAFNPPLSELKTLPAGAKTKYVDICYCQDVANALFQGIWGYKILSYNVLEKSAVVHISLTYRHPIFKEDLTTEGIGANKISYSLDNSLPTAKTSAVKNALKTLGNLFGRELDSKENEVIATIIQKSEQDLIFKIKSTDNLESLNAVVNNGVKYSENVRVAASERILELSKK